MPELKKIKIRNWFENMKFSSRWLKRYVMKGDTVCHFVRILLCREQGRQAG